MTKDTRVEKRTHLSYIQNFFHTWHVDALLLIIGGIFIALMIYCFVFIWNFNSPKIQYSPNDIVYAGSFQAVHAMDTSASLANLPMVPTTTAGFLPEMVISERYYDFGIVEPSQIAERVFIIANRGQSPLLIRRAYTTCGCTVADFTASEIPPGKVVLMKLHFDPGFHDLRGTTVRRGVIIQTNDPDQPQQEIWIQATVR